MKRIALCLWLVSVPTASAQTAADLLKEATAAANAGKADAALALASQAIERAPKNADAYLLRASIHESAKRYEKAVADLTQTLTLQPDLAAAYQQRGMLHFKLGQVDPAIRDFDRYIELRPQEKVRHWQRGIAYYYAGRYDEGRRQFEGYQDYDRNDVENAVWRFLCMARKDGMAKARAGILKIGDDRRVPMRQVYDLFKGDLQPADVLAAARAGNPPKDQLSTRLFYAYLYVGIYYDLIGDRKQALANLDLAVAHRIDHTMGDVARVHRDLLKQRQDRPGKDRP